MADLNRRTVLKTACAGSASLVLPSGVFAGFDPGPPGQPIRLGVMADLHGGLAVDAEARLDGFLASMATRDPHALIQLGDFAYPNRQHQLYADKLNAAHVNVLHVIGNHEFDYGLTRGDCFRAWGIEAAYYRRDLRGIRILVLDGNDQGSPDHAGRYPCYIGKKQQEWLEHELQTAECPVLILSHQPLAGPAAIDNAVEIQALLGEYRRKIVLCLNGHSHVDSLLQVAGVNCLHVNSVSCHWVGGDKRMAGYQDPLYCMITMDPGKAEIVIEGTSSAWKKGDDPALNGYFDPVTAPPETVVVPAIRSRRLVGGRVVSTRPADFDSSAESGVAGVPLRVMTWNIWGRLNQDPRYSVAGKTARQRTIDIIRNSGADIVLMIETYGSAEDIAGALGFHYHTPAADANLCIFSRYPLSDSQSLEGLSSFSFIAATATLPDGQKIRLYDVWLTSGGRHIVEIRNPGISDQEFCDGDDIRNEMLEKFLQHDDVRQHLANVEAVPVIVAGDFNCVSHLDHNKGTRHSRLNHSRILPVKVSRAMHKAGFTDTYRATNPDILESTLGHTWTTVGMGFVYRSDEGFVPVDENPQPQYRDPYARIDYIYSRGARLRPLMSTVMTRHPAESQRSFPEFPSDHAAVLTEFRVARQ